MRLRREVAGAVGWLGVLLDEAANRAQATLIAAPSSRVRVFVIPTDEESRIAEWTREVALSSSIPQRSS